ncbi:MULTISPECIES: hypothetical protein [Sorangium]|uniref:Uncharacterized protein n=1 Tax=Sorangium cellulosum TaxID=56 RepID=A0A4P2R3S7_SORCE|nr:MULTISPECIES: hypothetical protein [Sorangium]AUX37251.1 hypothetical protein SOCE836_094730 [Sorangium cellulosum]WCQ96540.1 hypothetical protein NQZ70_09327 [Sorangium sp. Soce836]
MATARTKKKSAPARPSAPDEAAEAFAQIEPELDRIEKVVPINVDIPRAVAVAVGAVPHLKALRARFLEELPRFPIEALDKLMSYALGAWYAHLLALPAGPGQDGLKPLLEEASALRADLLVAAEALAHKGFVDAGRVAEIRSGNGHLDTANDLVALAALFGESWGAVKHKTTVEWPDVERASKLGPELLVALGARNQPGVPAPKAADPADRRARAFTLLVRAYDQCRRGVTYLRWVEGDYDAIAPSLFAGRGGARRGAPAKDEATDEGAEGEPAGESGLGLGDGETLKE